MKRIPNAKKTSEKEEGKGRVKVGKLSKPVKDLSARNQKQIKGGTRRADPTTGYSDAAGG